MDLETVRQFRPAVDRADLALLDAFTIPVAGGSHLYGYPDDSLDALLDLTTFDWPTIVVHHDEATGDDELEIGATCTLAELSRLPARPGWAAHPLFFQCCTALLGSFKVWNVATVGGNIATSLPAGPMTSLTAGLDAYALIWSADAERTLPVAELVTGNATNALATGEVIRSLHVPADSLRSRTGFRQRALSPLGRSGAVVVGRLAPSGAFVVTVTAATTHPVQLRYESLPGADTLATDVGDIDAWFTDPHGAADWRRAVSTVLAEEIRIELAS